MGDSAKFVGQVIKIEVVGCYYYASILLDKEDLILYYYSTKELKVGYKVAVTVSSKDGIEVVDCRIINENIANKVVKSTIEGANEKELIAYLKTVSYMNLIFDRVKSDPDKIDSNTLYEVFFAKDTIEEMLKNSISDKLVKQEAEEMLSSLNGIISLLGEERIKQIYIFHGRSKSITKKDKLKYENEEGFNGKLERKLLKIKSQLFRLLGKLVLHKIPLTAVSIILYKASSWLPKLVEYMYGPLIFDNTRDITGELIHSFGPNVMALSNIMVALGAFSIGLIFIQLMLNVAYIGLSISFKACGENEFVRVSRKFVDSRTVELCDKYIKIIEVKEEYTIDDRIKRNKKLLEELEEDTEVFPRGLKVDLLNEIHRYSDESTSFIDKFKGEVLIEKTYDKYRRIKNQFYEEEYEETVEKLGLQKKSKKKQRKNKK